MQKVFSVMKGKPPPFGPINFLTVVTSHNYFFKIQPISNPQLTLSPLYGSKPDFLFKIPITLDSMSNLFKFDRTVSNNEVDFSNFFGVVKITQILEAFF